MDADLQTEMTGLFFHTLHNLADVMSLMMPCAINPDSLKDKHGVGDSAFMTTLI